MTGWVSSGALILLMAAAALCYPFRQAVAPRSFPTSHYRPQVPMQEFAPQVSVAGAVPPAVKEDALQYANVWPYDNEQLASSGAENVDEVVDSDEKPDVSSGVAFAELPVPGGPAVPAFGPILPHPQMDFKPGELFRLEKTFEHGDYESEHETQGTPQRPRPLPRPVPLDSAPDGVARFSHGIPPPPISRPYVPYPFDYFFLTGQYAPGTATHFSSSFERGRNYNQDLHYEKYEEEEPMWPWAYAAEPPQNAQQAGGQESGANDRVASVFSSGYYAPPYNQPREVQLPPRYYRTYNHPSQVKVSPHYFRSRVEH